MSDNSYIESRILLIEDEESLAIGLEYNFTEEGYIVTRAKDGREALDLFENNEYDLILLDIMLPYHDGFEIARIVREKNPQIPILMLTARSKNEDIIKGLQEGADDYITKPFQLKELLLRVKGMLKRKMWYKNVTSQQPVYKFGNCEINFEDLSAKNKDSEFRLTHQEAMVMRYLIDHKGKIISRSELLENVWHLNPDIESRTVDIFISRLRKYFEENPSNPEYIKSVRGAGYVFEE